MQLTYRGQAYELSATPAVDAIARQQRPQYS